ncbi:MAG: hypothetical protein ACOCXJ_00660 [Planctomycetota bacterium]
MGSERIGATLIEVLAVVALLTLFMGSIGAGLLPFLRALDQGQEAAGLATRAQLVIRSLQDDCAGATQVRVETIDGESICRLGTQAGPVLWRLNDDTLLRAAPGIPPEPRITGVDGFHVEPHATGYLVRLVLRRDDQAQAVFQSAMASRLQPRAEELR